jgi:hypothetical protein
MMFGLRMVTNGRLHGPVFIHKLASLPSFCLMQRLARLFDIALT